MTGTGVYRLEQLAGGKARVHIETKKAVLAKPKRGSNRIKPKNKRKRKK